MPIFLCFRIKISVAVYLICSSVAGVEPCQLQYLLLPTGQQNAFVVGFFLFFFKNAKYKQIQCWKKVLLLFCSPDPTLSHT